jgi:hypothetical protein
LSVPTTDIDNLTIVRDQKLAEMLDVSLVTLWRMRDDLPPKVQISKGIKGRRLSDLKVWFEKRAAR